MRSFTEKNIIVTGSASGIGTATATRIAREGGRVVASDIAADKLDSLVAELRGSNSIAVTGTMTKQVAVGAVIAAAGNRIDGLASVAGINDDFPRRGRRPIVCGIA